MAQSFVQYPIRELSVILHASLARKIAVEATSAIILFVGVSHEYAI